MNFLGMGPLEILVILAIAFIFLGPERMIDAAKTLGKLAREARSIASEVPRVVVEDDDLKIVSDGKTTSLSGAPPPAEQAPSAPPRPAAPSDRADSGAGSEPDAPIAFSRQSPPPPPEAEAGESRDAASR